MLEVAGFFQIVCILVPAQSAWWPACPAALKGVHDVRCSATHVRVTSSTSVGSTLQMHVQSFDVCTALCMLKHVAVTLPAHLTKPGKWKSAVWQDFVAALAPRHDICNVAERGLCDGSQCFMCQKCLMRCHQHVGERQQPGKRVVLQENAV